MLVIKCVMSSLVRVCLVMQCAPNLMLDYSCNTWVSVPDSNYGNDGDVVASASRVHLEMLDFLVQPFSRRHFSSQGKVEGFNFLD